jgi:mannose-1-phosphate guanylyltransferase
MVSHNSELITQNSELLKHAYCVIMAGGRGERFWPLSADNMPKPFLKILGEKTMIQLTVERVGRLLPVERIFIVIGKSHADIARGQLPDLPEANFLVEPVGRDTAPCIGFAAISLLGIDSQAVMIVLPADHYIPDSDHFIKTISYGADIASSGDYLVTIGIRPVRPETGYGYINACEQVFSSESGVCLKVERFIEKPDFHRARQYLDEGNYFWNAGMFIWKAKTVLAGIAQHMPELSKGLLKMKVALAAHDEGLFAGVFSSLVRQSIDFGLMEKADNVLMIPGEFTWDDVGTWSSLLRVKDLDENGNYCSGDIVCVGTKNSVICSEGPTVGAMGVSDVVIIVSGNGVLVCSADRAQEVREIARLVEAKREKRKL